VPGEEFIVMRDGSRPLPDGVRVIREAPTYFLCELQLDGAALDALERRDVANEAVARAETAVRERLTEQIAGSAPSLQMLSSALGSFDVLLASVAFTQRYACVVPEIVEAAGLSFQLARFLPLAEELERTAGRYEPISLDISDVTVVTGPNMGGKSAALRTCAFLAALASFGIPVPARAARISLFDRIAWIGVGVDEETGGLLSSFAREIVRLREVLGPSQGEPRRPLLLVDEFARTTTPREGKALTIALVESLRSKGWAAIVATHLSGVANRAGIRHFAVRGLRAPPPAPSGASLEEALSALAASMDYTLEEVHGGYEPVGDAIALARLLGLDAGLVARAAEVLNEGVEGEQLWIR
jgi:DNA mismatch repair protein MutS2